MKCTMSELTVADLTEHLKDLVHWEIFAIHLPGIRQADIDIIRRDRPSSIVDQKQTLFDKWLRSYPSASWEAVVLALEKVDENKIVTKLLSTLPDKALLQKWQIHKENEKKRLYTSRSIRFRRI